MNIKPLSDRVLVEPAAAETKTAGGIYIPDTAIKERKDVRYLLSEPVFNYVDEMKFYQ